MSFEIRDTPLQSTKSAAFPSVPLEASRSTNIAAPFSATVQKGSQRKIVQFFGDTMVQQARVPSRENFFRAKPSPSLLERIFGLFSRSQSKVQVNAAQASAAKPLMEQARDALDEGKALSIDQLEALKDLCNRSPTQAARLIRNVNQTKGVTSEQCSALLKALSPQQGLKLIKSLISQEMAEYKKNGGNIDSLFRNNVATTRMISAYQLHVLPSLTRSVQNMRITLPRTSYEETRDKAQGDKRVLSEAGKKQCEANAAEILNHVIEQTAHVSPEIKELNRFFKDEVEKHYPGNGETFGLQLFTLRYLCGVIAKPEPPAEGLDQQSRQGLAARNKNCIQISHLIQAAANKLSEAPPLIQTRFVALKRNLIA